MKKVIIYSVAILSVFISTSCTADSINEIKDTSSNSTIVETGDNNTTPPKK